MFFVNTEDTNKKCQKVDPKLPDHLKNYSQISQIFCELYLFCYLLYANSYIAFLIIPNTYIAS